MIGKPFGRAGTGESAIPPGRRSDARVRLHLPARLILLTGTQNCILEDLSITGAAIITQEALPAVGASAILQCEHIEGFGQVRWARYGRCGLMFEEKLPLAQVVSLRHLADHFEAAQRERYKQSARDWVQGKSRIV